MQYGCVWIAICMYRLSKPLRFSLKWWRQTILENFFFNPEKKLTENQVDTK